MYTHTSPYTQQKTQFNFLSKTEIVWHSGWDKSYVLLLSRAKFISLIQCPSSFSSSFFSFWMIFTFSCSSRFSLYKFKLVNWHIHIKPEIKNTSISSHKIWLTGVNYWKVCLKCLQFSIFKERVLIGCQTTNTSMICLQFSIFKERVLIGCQITNTSVTCLQLSVVVLSYPHHFLHVVELLVEILFVFVVVLQRFGQLGKLVEPGSIHTLPVLQVVYNKLQSRFTVKMHSSHEERFSDLVIRGT